jgi:AraC-like DNA-binding protein
MSYHEHAPPAELAPWLECFWERRGEAGPPVRVVPDGCMDVVFIAGAGAQVVGPNTTAFLVSLDAGVPVVGARMLPGCAPALLGVGAEALRDARVPLAQALARDGARLEQLLFERHDTLAALQTALIARAARAQRPDPLVRAAIERLERPDVAIAELARELGVSERQLRRRVSAVVGYGPRRLARILRLGQALEAARAGGELARVAHESGYADQAHFANDCRALAGVSPSQLLAA